MSLENLLGLSSNSNKYDDTLGRIYYQIDNIKNKNELINDYICLMDDVFFFYGEVKSPDGFLDYYNKLVNPDNKFSVPKEAKEYIKEAKNFWDKIDLGGFISRIITDDSFNQARGDLENSKFLHNYVLLNNNI